MIAKDFKMALNSELKHARVSNTVTKVTEDKQLHTVIAFKKPITDAHKMYLAVRFKRVSFNKNNMTILHPNEV
jgi:hypothetical protein